MNHTKSHEWIHQLSRMGWLHISRTMLNDIACSVDLMSLAHALGTPVRQSNVPLVQRITPQTQELARSNTMSALFGIGEFPPHTDAAHWPVPPRYVLLQCEEGVDIAPTLIADAATLLNDVEQARELSRAVWQIKKVVRSFVCSAVFDAPGGKALRWDPCVMIPVTGQANAYVAEQFAALCHDHPLSINWNRGDILIIDNWRMFHWRPRIAANSEPRVLLRVLVATAPQKTETKE